jgi:Glycosyl hydrolases family 43.
MKLENIHIRDPFILLHEDTYYLYGSRGAEAWGACTGFDVYVSDDLIEWSNPIICFNPPEHFWSHLQYWAPEVHQYHDKFYMFASFKSPDRCRGTQILVSDSPLGPFLLHSDGPVTPKEWECLDGTLYIDRQGTPYIVFCHEWTQIKNGELCAARLSLNLKETIENPIVLFRASEPDWAPKNKVDFVTDGPFLYRTAENKLLMIWSSFDAFGYVEAIASSDNGEINGKWLHQKELLFSNDGGHGMIFHTKTGELMFVMHRPNHSPLERPVLIEIGETDGTLRAK